MAEDRPLRSIGLLVGLAALACSVVLLPASVGASPAPATPSVTSVVASSGPVAGHARITVSGANFVKGATVHFGSAVGTAVSVASTRRLTVTTPAHAVGVVDVRVTGRGRTSPVRAADHYSYLAAPSVTGLTPTASTSSGGGSATIRGTGFTRASTVRFGTTAASATYVSANQLKVIVPAHDNGTVTVSVRTAYGTSAATSATSFVYRDAPATLTGLTLADVSTTSATLRWTAPPAGDADTVVIRRNAGAVAPATASDGQAVATVPASTTGLIDTSLSRDSSYTYALFAATTVGPLYSSAATLTITTPADSHPDVPSRLDVPPSLVGNCVAAPYALLGTLGGQPLTLAAYVSDPDGPGETLTTTFRLWDETDGGRTYLTGDGGATVTGSGGRYAIVRLDGSLLTDGHLYGFDATTSDGTLNSATSSPCRFRFDATAPTPPAVTPAQTTYQVGTPATFHLSSSDVAPTSGSASGLDHFNYSFSSSSDLSSSVAAKDDGTADVTTTPTVWGTNYLYVQAVDRAGNRSPVSTYSFYVMDG